jgi:SH3-like domain-containing protein
MLLRAWTRFGAGLALFLWASASAPAPADQVIAPSGKPVPRFESLKYGEVNGRLGPSFDHRVLWTYHRRGLPLRVTAESGVWRQVADPDGDVSWISAAQLDDQPTVYVFGSDPLPLRRAPEQTARPVALLGHGVVGELEKCKGGWRQIKVGGKTGWAPMASLWGAPACREEPQ